MLSNQYKKPEHHTAFIDARTGESLSLYGLRRMTGTLHAGLLRYGLKKGDAVCTYIPNNIYMAPIYMGTMSAGIAISPANTSYVSSELQRQLKISNSKVLIAHPSNLDIALDAAAAVGLPRACVFSIVRDPKQRVPLWSDVFIDYSQPALDPIPMTHQESVNTTAYLCFSSGTTGKSKGVITSHYNVISMVMETNNFAGIFQMDPPPNKVMAAVIPLYHFSGVHRFMNTGIPQGATTVIVEKYSIRTLCETIQRFKVTDFSSAPPIVIHLVNRPECDEYDLSSLQAIGCGSAPLSAAIIERFKEKYKIPLTQGYGLTEMSPVITYQLPEWARPDSVGRVAPFMKAKVVDPSTGREQGVNEPGELCVKGPNVTQGYKDDPEATANTIDKDGWFHTGDIVRIDQKGDVYVVDRIKELIKYKGFQVAPVELESVLLQSPHVADAGVIGIYDEAQGTEIPLAYVVTHQHIKQDNKSELETTICDWVNARVANHKRLRGGVRIIDAIPKNGAGKIMRKEMKAIYENQQKRKSKL
ncbi:acetyl-CoA synthetase-like protein [Lichtheimia hyalospora FSU 10163]|nr:acetyl-CoA synthetase-like protein [Lichtheimia hyalospora FSU 10163]